MTIHYRIGEDYLGGYDDGAYPTEAGAELCSAPPHGLAKWQGGVWVWEEPEQLPEETTLQKINRLMAELEELKLQLQ